MGRAALTLSALAVLAADALPKVRVSLSCLHLGSSTHYTHAAAFPPLPQVALDTDIGTDFDDMWAMMYLLSKSIPSDPGRLFDFALVQCSTFNTTNRARIATKAMFDVGRFDVPVAVGAYTGEDAMNQLPAAAGWELADFVAAGGTVLYGTDHLSALLAAATPAAPLFVVEIAPATSLGDVVRAAPALAANAIVSAMSGSVYHGYGNSSAPQREYNVAEDVAASQAMYAARWLSPLLMAPLDTSGLLHCIKPEFSDLIAANSSAHVYAQVLLKNYQIWCRCTPTDGSESDTLCAFPCACPGSCRAPAHALKRTHTPHPRNGPSYRRRAGRVLGRLLRGRVGCGRCAHADHPRTHARGPAHLGKRERLHRNRPRRAASLGCDELPRRPRRGHAPHLRRAHRQHHCRLGA